MRTDLCLLLDFGGVVLRTPFELRSLAERSFGLPSGYFDWEGPFNPDSDPLWQEFLAGKRTERGYWAERAALVGQHLGRDLATREFMLAFYEPIDERVLIRPEWTAVIDEVKASGLKLGVLTNDMEAFHGPGFAPQINFLHRIDSMVDGSITGILKPDPRSYLAGVEALGSAPERTVFVDDLQVNIDGAQAAGLRTVKFDVTDVPGSLARVRHALGED